MTRKPRLHLPRAKDAPPGYTKNPPLRISVSLACMDSVEASFAYDLAKMTAYAGVTLVARDIAELRINMLSSSILSSSRNDLAREAMENGSTHVLCIDSDMRFPKESLNRLLKHQKDIVGINYSTRKVPPDFVAFKHISRESGDPHVKLETLPDSTGLEKVEALGFGLILIRTDVFRSMPYPGFETIYDRERNMWIGEDVDFCKKATAAGFDIWADHDLSKECAHIGRMEYLTAHVEKTKDMDRGEILPEEHDVSPLALEA